MKRFITLFAALLVIQVIDAQNLMLPLDDTYNYREQAAAYSSKQHFHTALKGLTIFDFNKITNVDSIRSIDHIKPERGYVWNSIFNKDVLRYKNENIFIAANPIMDFEVGKDKSRTIWENRRGVEIKGDIYSKVSFNFQLNETQLVLPEYLTKYARKNGVVPGQGYGSRFKTDGFDLRTTASAYINWRMANWFTATLGYGKNFIGDGYRSMLISDNAYSYPYLRLTADFWHIQYSCIYSQMTDKNTLFVIDDASTDVARYGRKWVIMHYLDWAVTKRINIGFFDVIIARAQNSNGTNRGFDVQYINPIIYLRQADYYSGSSPDNALLGFNASIILGKHTTIYGQFALDEMIFKDFISFKGMRDNKQSYQLGVKSYDCFGIENLFLQLEGNIVRPYMYAHRSGMDNYAHYNQPLAHPWGANFWECVVRAQYNYKRFYFQYKFNGGQWGDDKENEYYGHNIFLDYRDAVFISGEDGREGHYLLTGQKNTLIMNDLTVSWLVNPSYNLNVFVEGTQRSRKIQDGENENTFIVSFGIRTSLDRHYYDF